MTVDQMTGILRAILAAIGGSLVAKGSITEEQAAQIGGAIVVLFTAGWSMWANYKQQKTINQRDTKIDQQDTTIHQQEAKIDQLRGSQ